MEPAATYGNPGGIKTPYQKGFGAIPIVSVENEFRCRLPDRENEIYRRFAEKIK